MLGLFARQRKLRGKLRGSCAAAELAKRVTVIRITNRKMELQSSLSMRTPLLGGHPCKVDTPVRLTPFYGGVSYLAGPVRISLVCP